MGFGHKGLFYGLSVLVFLAGLALCAVGAAGSVGSFVLKVGLTRFFRFDGGFDFFFNGTVCWCWSALVVCGACVLLFVGFYFDASRLGDYLSVLLVSCAVLTNIVGVSGASSCTGLVDC